MQGTVTLSGSHATLTTPALEVGSHAIAARYSGDAGHAPSSSPVVYQTVTTVATATALTSSANPSPWLKPVTSTAWPELRWSTCRRGALFHPEICVTLAGMTN